MLCWGSSELVKFLAFISFHFISPVWVGGPWYHILIWGFGGTGLDSEFGHNKIIIDISVCRNLK